MRRFFRNLFFWRRDMEEAIRMAHTDRVNLWEEIVSDARVNSRIGKTKVVVKLLDDLVKTDRALSDLRREVQQWQEVVGRATVESKAAKSLAMSGLEHLKDVREDMLEGAKTLNEAAQAIATLRDEVGKDKPAQDADSAGITPEAAAAAVKTRPTATYSFVVDPNLARYIWQLDRTTTDEFTLALRTTMEYMLGLRNGACYRYMDAIEAGKDAVRRRLQSVRLEEIRCKATELQKEEEADGSR